MSTNERKALRRPFLRALFRKNKFNFAMSVIASLCGAGVNLVISWLIKEIADLISGDCPYTFVTLLYVMCGGMALFAVGWAIEIGRASCRERVFV